MRNRYHVLLRQILDDMQSETSAWPFLKPVDSAQVKDYYETIKQPMGTP
jgi:histone acetyltransferase